VSVARPNIGPVTAPHPHDYDPWAALAAHWPEVDVVVEPMAGRLLGQLRYPVIALRAGTSAAQRRCTLTHELVHLERGVRDCGPWADREEASVEAEAARRLISADALRRALRELGCRPGISALAAVLDVDSQTLRTRLAMLTVDEATLLDREAGDDLWRVA
jgi:hypothetical protein